jgi:hypothetical protein
MADHEKQIEDFGKNNDFWLFGYGYEQNLLKNREGHVLDHRQLKLTITRSLIWKPPPHFGTVHPITQKHATAKSTSMKPRADTAQHQTSEFQDTSKVMCGDSGRYEQSLRTRSCEINIIVGS